MSIQEILEDPLVDTPFGRRPLTETFGLVTQLEALGCLGTARLLRDHIQHIPTQGRAHAGTE